MTNLFHKLTISANPGNRVSAIILYIAKINTLVTD